MNDFMQFFWAQNTCKFLVLFNVTQNLRYTCMFCVKAPHSQEGLKPTLECKEF